MSLWPAGSAAWGDLQARVVSGAVLAAVALAAILLGGVWLAALVGLGAGVMAWELHRLLGREAGGGLVPLAVGVLAGLAVFSTLWLGACALLLFLVPVAVGWIGLTRDRTLWAATALALALCGYVLITFRASHGAVWVCWLVLVVIAADVAGYFAGRTIGGPKLWPEVSPNKTWSGTVAGWAAAALVGAVFYAATDAGAGIVCLSVGLAVAGQLGDLAESALKRRVGVKDASSLIPGHGGLLDRFDALVGATLALLFAGALTGLPLLQF